MPADQKKRVKAQSLGPGRGVNVSVSKTQLEKAGVDPDADLEVARYVFEGDGTIRLRFYEQTSDNEVNSE
ncbi:hypothetical protein [Natrialba sp. SSL1]|uniref:hypothetical protein n=1 Tax=Natrialba sp. SSL1 TaxID=1869245 RepID=UPI0008F8A0A4|nr:hypothetical protein [Natrialba sp. SSL1]OIB58182.1 hypothetical protein BBD46_09905 [Natrialba sp. SSL1]